MLYHGWHHICFVKSKSLQFARAVKANRFLVESAALVHDLNYVVKPNSDPEDGEEIRRKVLLKCRYDEDEINSIEKIIIESHTSYRQRRISKEAKSLSDADSLFKVIPTNTIIFTRNYITQNKVDVKKLASKIIDEQQPLLQQGIYFYTKEAKQKYLEWAKRNIALWEIVQDALDDKDVKEMLAIAKKIKVI